MSRRRPIHFNVAPRYTPGSPAMVDERTALRVAAQEKEAYEHALTGVYGDKDKETAEKLGLHGIAEERTEMPKGWQVKDLCTGESHFRPFDSPTARRSRS